MRELLPSLVLEARQHGVRAFVIEHGTPYSHAAILARSFGQPVIRMPAIETLRSHEGESRERFVASHEMWDVHKSGYDETMLRELVMKHGFVKFGRLRNDP